LGKGVVFGIFETDSKIANYIVYFGNPVYHIKGLFVSDLTKQL